MGAEDCIKDQNITCGLPPDGTFSPNGDIAGDGVGEAGVISYGCLNNELYPRFLVPLSLRRL